MKQNNKVRPVLSTALLKVKYIYHDMNPESIPFEEFVNSSDVSLRIDFPDGRYFMEDGFRSIASPIDKFYMEFFDEFQGSNIMDYLSSEKSNYRVTSLDGSIVRLSHDDYEAIPREIREDSSNVLMKEYVYVKKKKSLFYRFMEMIEKKDN